MRPKSFGWAILASVVVVAAVVFKLHNAGTGLPSPRAVVIARHLGYTVSLASIRSSLPATEAVDIAARGHNGVTLSPQSLSPATLVWWGRRPPRLAWVMLGRPAQRSRSAVWLVVINARSGAWVVERRVP
jgi:hypothetical protein